MKKSEMISEIINACNWPESSKMNNYNRAMRYNKETVRGVYDAFINDNKTQYGVSVRFRPGVQTTGRFPGNDLILSNMEIYRIVIDVAGTLDTICFPRVFHKENAARKCARAIKDEGYWDEHEIGAVKILKERADMALGWFVTIGIETIGEE